MKGDSPMIVHPLRLWYLAERGVEAPTGSATCWFCGFPCTAAGDESNLPNIHVIRARAAISGNFTDFDHAHGRAVSDVLCAACAGYFGYTMPEYEGRGGAAGKLFTYHLRVGASGWSPWERDEILPDLQSWIDEGSPEPMALTVCFSRKKHTLPFARINPAGARRLAVMTDAGEARVGPGFMISVGAVAWLWSRGHPKGSIGDARPSSSHLAASDDPAGDLAAFATLRPMAGTALLRLATYTVTEENRDGCAREFASVLQRIRRVSAARGAVAGAAEPWSQPGIQEPVSAPVVDDPGGAREVVRQDEPGSHPLEQLHFL